MLRKLELLVLLVVVTLSSQDLVINYPSHTNIALPENVTVRPIVKALHVESSVRHRYSTTLVASQVVNPAPHAGEASFTVILPDTAFISDFLMEVKGKVYKAYVKEKQEAEEFYDDAVQNGRYAGHVGLNARDSNEFTISVNIEAYGKVTFILEYQQMLIRKLGFYTNTININPQQIVEDMLVKVNIEELSAIRGVEVHMPSNFYSLTNRAVFGKISSFSPYSKQVIWRLTAEQQRRLQKKHKSGVSGQLVVKYDVDREDNPQQILVDEGYFLHFFAPDNLPQLRKHVVFVLDWSGSMEGRKLEQLKEAMNKILSDIDPNDYFSLVFFESDVYAWSPKMAHSSTSSHVKTSIVDHEFLIKASPDNINLAQIYLRNNDDHGATNIMGGLRTGLNLVQLSSDMWINESEPPQPIVIFLTDGLPNEEESDGDVIIAKTNLLNSKRCPIYSLGFGSDADFTFLRKLSLSNNGFARNIYEAADASEQLENFYHTVASPLLSNVTFNYLPGQVESSSNTQVKFPVFFKGSEIIVAGKVKMDMMEGNVIIGELRGITATGIKTYPIVADVHKKSHKQYSGHLEKAWVYMRVQQLIDKLDTLDDGEEKRETKAQALQLALDYSFVTPLTSLVVVMPNGNETAVETIKVLPELSSTLPPNIKTTITTTISPTEGPIHKVGLSDIKWLPPHLANSAKFDKAFITIRGQLYSLALIVTDELFGSCQVKTVGPGECHHFKFCPLSVFVKSFKDFLPYKCIVPGGFLGVCCPQGIN